MYGTSLQLTELTVSSTEPLTTAVAKAHLRVDHSDDDTEIDDFSIAARQHAEQMTGRSIVERTLRLDLPRFSNVMVLPKPPLVSLTNVKYYDLDNSLQTLASTEYETDIPGHRVLLAYGKTWPSTYERNDAVQITYAAGYAVSASPQVIVPKAIVAAIKLLMADMYEHREARAVLRMEDNPTVDRLLAPYNVLF